MRGCRRETEDEELPASLHADVRDRLLRAWRGRLARLAKDEFRYRGVIAYVTGRLPA